MSGAKPLAEGFSAEGYIRDQDCFSSLRYRTMPASVNGCGWIAAYNLRRFLGQTEDWDAVRRELDGLHPVRLPGPTLLGAMRAYLARYVPGITETAGREEALAAMARSRAGILRYREGWEPHFIFYLRRPEGFRFFNVADGLEDAVMPLEQFGAEHLRGGLTVLFSLSETPVSSPEGEP